MEAEIRKAITESELTHYRIAKNADISQTSMSLFVNGIRSMSLGNASKVATALGLEIVHTKKSARKRR